jgi:PAS domain S-box-containing protein
LAYAFNETVKTLKEKNDAIINSNNLLKQKNQEIEQQKTEIDQKHEKLTLYAQEISQTNKKLENARQEQQKFVAMADNSSDLIAMYDFNGKLLYINPAGRMMLGIKQDQSIQHITIADIVGLNKNSTLIDRVLSEVKRQGFMKQEMLVYHTVSGNPIQVEALTFVITDDNKFLCLATMMRDIRDRKKAEKELKEYSERLAAINKEMEEKQIQNKLQSEELHKSHEELLKKNQDLAHQRDSIAAKNREITLTIDQLNQTIRRLRETQTQLVEAEKMASLGQLTAGIAHEINNPINFISGNIEPLRMNIQDLKNLINELNTIKNLNDLEKIKKLEEEIQLDVLLKELDSLLEGIEEGARRTKEIVLGLRNFSRLDEHDLKKANINEGLHSTIVLLRSKLKACNIDLQENYDLLPYISCYPGKLNQVFMNIISNAIHAVEKAKKHENGAVGRICITTKDLEKEICICIEDNGIGMSKKVIKRIFEPFFTTKEVGDGTGLGLSITHGIIQQHHGQIKVESEEGKGSIFTILIPKNLDELIESI